MHTFTAVHNLQLISKVEQILHILPVTAILNEILIIILFNFFF